MINLLPQSEKKKLRKEFYQRYAVVMLGVVLLSEALLFLSIIPSYVTLNASVNDLTQKLDEKKKEILPGGDEAQAQLNTIKGEITLLKPAGGAGDIPPTEILTKILSQKPDGVLVSHYSYVRSAAGASVQLSGIGSTRESLLLFQKLLSDKTANPHFSDAKYAQGFLLKKNDIDYILTVTVN